MTQALPKNYQKNYEPLASHESLRDDESLTGPRIPAGQGRAPFPAPERRNPEHRNPDRRDSNTLDADTLDANYLAHDACNWLTVLQVYCDLLRTSGAVATGYQRWIDELSSAVERGHGLVASLLDSVQQATEAMDGRERNSRDAIQSTRTLERIALDSTMADRRWAGASLAARPAAPMHVALNVAAAIARRLPVLQHMAGANIQVEFDASNNAGLVALPESVFERILHNLVGNAIEAMPKGGRLRIVLRRRNRVADDIGGVPATPLLDEIPAQPGKALALRRGERRSARTPEVRKRAASKTLLLRISDTGDGIAADRLHSIFEAGVSGKPEREPGRQPRGFGLAIVRELTQRAGGAVRVRSRPGRGSCFEIELPRV